MKCKYYMLYVSGLTNSDPVVLEATDRTACMSNKDKSYEALHMTKKEAPFNAKSHSVLTKIKRETSGAKYFTYLLTEQLGRR